MTVWLLLPGRDSALAQLCAVNSGAGQGESSLQTEIAGLTLDGASGDELAGMSLSPSFTSANVAGGQHVRRCRLAAKA